MRLIKTYIRFIQKKDRQYSTHRIYQPTFDNSTELSIVSFIYYDTNNSLVYSQMITIKITKSCVTCEQLFSLVPKIVAWITLGVYVHKALKCLKLHTKTLTKHLSITRKYPTIALETSKHPRVSYRYVTKFLGIIKIKEETKGTHLII